MQWMPNQHPTLSAQLAELSRLAPTGAPGQRGLYNSIIAMVLACLHRLIARLADMALLWQAGQLPVPQPRVRHFAAAPRTAHPVEPCARRRRMRRRRATIVRATLPRAHRRISGFAQTPRIAALPPCRLSVRPRSARAPPCSILAHRSRKHPRAGRRTRA